LKRILVLTSIYPSSDATKGTTPVVHYFCKEWVKQGHEVIVIHNDNKYLLIFYFLSNFVKNYITSKFGVIFPNTKMRKSSDVLRDNVKVFRRPILKLVPFGLFSNYQLKKQLKEIEIILKNEDFIPDVITGHWENPQIELIFELNKKYKKAKTSLVIHLIKYLNKPHLRDKLESFDSVGFRNKTLMKNAIKSFSLKNPFFYICYSGLQRNFYESIKLKKIRNKFDSKKIQISYVGIFQERKFPVAIVKAINNLKEEFEFHVDFVGEGKEQSNVKKLVDDYNLNKNVLFHNRINKEEVQKVLIKSQVFVMISKDEAYGLAYLEAMACGCIVIASKNEGFDGIIKDGENGFLCEAGNYEELTKILRNIQFLSIDDKIKISQDAIKTANELTNKNVSKKYLKDILTENI